MKISVIGTGRVGAALGPRWAQKGHQVTYGTRNPDSEKAKELVAHSGGSADAALPPDAAASANVIVLATPWEATEGIIRSLGPIEGKIIADCTNPLDGLNGLTVGHSNSGGERVAKWASGARVVKAFNMTGSGNMENPSFGSQSAAMFLCGDDKQATDTVVGLAEELGFDAYNVGGLDMARYLEPMAMLWINMAYQQGLGPDFAFSVLKRART